MQKTIYLTILALSIAFSAIAQQSTSNYKEMMYDMNVNFYDVCEAADLYFETHDKGRGSGWKGYQRWKAEEESKYYPSGDRSQVEAYFVENAYREFVKESGLFQTISRTHENGWRELGPGIVDNITSHYSPGIGRVEALWVNPSNDQHIYMGSRSGGFWRSIDGGYNWINTTDTLIASGVNTIGVSPTNPDSILINVQNGGNGFTHGIYRSTDGGMTWVISAFNPSNLGWGGLGNGDQIYKVVYHPQNPNIVFVGTNKGLFRSTDGLQTWTQPITSGQITDIEFMPSDINRVYVYDDRNNSAYANNVLYSTNLGLSFTPSQNINGNNEARGHISTTPDCTGCVFFASTNGVWKSDDYGMSFSLLSIPTESCLGFAVSDQDADFMIYGYVDIERTTDGGQNFSLATDWSINGTSLPSDYVHADLRTAECVNGVFYVGTDGFLCKSIDNGLNWIPLNNSNNGTGIREFYAGGLSQSDWRVQMAGSQDNGTSILDQTGWIEWNGGDGMEALVQPLRPDWMIGSWQFGTRNITRDAGQSRQASGNPEGGSPAADWIAPLLMNPNHQMEIYHFGSSMYRSKSFGDNDWEYIGSPNIDNIKVGAIAENNSGIIAVARDNALRISIDTGATWIQPSGTLPNFSITDIAFDPNRDSTLIVTYNRRQNDGFKVFISHDLGSSWTNITGNLGDMPLRSVVIDHTPESNIYLGAEIGVYTKPMNGGSWTLYNPNLPNLTVRDLEIQYGTNILRAFTWGRGLWDYKLVGRLNFPAITITELSEFPMLPAPNPVTDQFVTARISYNQVLSSVYVLWSDSIPTLENSIAMINIQDSTWKSETFIPHFPEGTDMYFKVIAVGAENDTTETYRFHYNSMQAPPPIDTTDTTTNDTTNSISALNLYENELNIYPNPTDGPFSINLGEWNHNVTVEVHNIQGKLVFEELYKGPMITVDRNLMPGNYLLTISGADLKDGTINRTMKLVIE